jgi:hypothetical protein
MGQNEAKFHRKDCKKGQFIGKNPENFALWAKIFKNHNFGINQYQKKFSVKVHSGPRISLTLPF